MSLHYISTRGDASPKTFADILTAGATEDGGLYMPAHWPCFSRDKIESLKGQPFAAIACEVLNAFTGDAFAPDKLRAFCDTAYGAFRHDDVCPLVDMGHNRFLLELHHGPTFAFKDIAMRILAQMVGAKLRRTHARASIICATSGDTGAAAVGAFKDIPHADVIVLFPEGRISKVQRRQMTASGAGNVLALSVNGDFDMCQALVKSLFADAAFASRHALTAVNSINFARIAAQVTYYFTAALRLGLPDNLVFCVPTGNFGDVLAGYIAKLMGLPVRRFIIATNDNDILVRALDTGIYEIEGVVPTTSPSMDIQVSSNFERLLFEVSHRDTKLVQNLMHDLKATGRFVIPADVLATIRNLFDAASASQEEVTAKIAACDGGYGMLVDPHTAVGLVAADKCAHGNDTVVTLSTAHPAKFSDAVKAATGRDVPLPPALAKMIEGEERFTRIEASLDGVKREIELLSSKGGV